MCGGHGVPIVWGYPTERTMRDAKQGLVVLAGCVVDNGIMPSHVCDTCDAEFVASNRLYKRVQNGQDVYGIAVWPQGRRSVRVESNDRGWTVVVDRAGSMLLVQDHLDLVVADVFHGMHPWEVEAWASKRGFPAQTKPLGDGWALEVSPVLAGLFELLLLKSWWRDLGRGAVQKAIDRLSCEVSSPIWMPDQS